MYRSHSCGCMWWGGNRSSTPSVISTLFLWNRVSHWLSLIMLGWPSSKSQQFFCLYLPDAMITSMSHTQPFFYKSSRYWIWVFMFALQAFIYQLSCLFSGSSAILMCAWIPLLKYRLLFKELGFPPPHYIFNMLLKDASSPHTYTLGSTYLLHVVRKDQPDLARLLFWMEDSNHKMPVDLIS